MPRRDSDSYMVVSVICTVDGVSDVCTQCEVPLDPNVTRTCRTWIDALAPEQRKEWMRLPTPLGTRLTHSFKRSSNRVEAPKECQHLLDPLDYDVAIKGCSCGAATRVYGCELYNLCAPIPKSKRTEIIDRPDVKLCLTCEHNPDLSP